MTALQPAAGEALGAYARRLLNVLLDKYERSKSFVGANRVRQTFTQRVDQLFPKYRDDAEYQVFREVNEGVADLERRGFVTVRRQRGGVAQDVTLNAARLGDVYRCLGRVPKSDVTRDLRRILSAYRDGNEILSAYCRRQEERLDANRSVEFFDGDLPEYEALLKAVSGVLQVRSETFERDFSIQVLGDSKAFERIRGKVAQLLYQYGDFPDRETLLADLNVIRNPGHVYFKGQGRISVCGQTIDFSHMNGDLALSSNLLRDIDRIEALGSAVVTVENLTAFNAFRCDDAFAIYLGGYHNACRRAFIRRVYEQNPDRRYLHFGDIDAGGFHILLHLRRRTGIAFEPYRMDAQTLRDHIQSTKRLTDHDRQRLAALVDTEFGETVRFMLEHDCKLEQEALDQSEAGA